VRLDEDSYLVLAGGSGKASLYRGEACVRPLAVFFEPELLAEARGAACAGASADSRGRAFALAEHLGPRSDAAGRRLRRIEQGLREGLDEAWFEEQIVLLLADVLDAAQALQDGAARLACAKPATRAELLRRLLLAADFMQSHYELPIALGDIAQAARLSRFHLVRLFGRLHGKTPREYLLAKRLAVAERLLRETRHDLSEVAVRSGFGTRSSLYRHLQRRLGVGGQALRSEAPLHAAPAQPAAACRIAA
jgi:AraC-like DNA-binding protein